MKNGSKQIRTGSLLIYSDIGSGATMKGRKRLNALISACRRGRGDMVLIKSASRFARNTVDALKMIRMLRRWNVDIYFEAEDTALITFFKANAQGDL